MLVSNRPGLGEIGWATGSFATFRQAMLESVSRGPRHPADPDDPRWPTETRSALAALTTRDDADYSIMAIDLFAAVADILSFYSERAANEMFLRTARERDSVVRLTGLIGYRPSPGTAATTSVALILDPGATVTITRGLKMMSVPGQDERPQTFETIGGVVADARLGDVPVFGAPQVVAPFDGGARIAIASRPATLVRGDTIILTDREQLERHRVADIVRGEDGEHVVLDRASAIAGADTAGFRLKRELSLFGHNTPPTWSFYNAALAPALRWTERAAGSADYPVNIASNQASYPLDRVVSDLSDGALLLIDLGPAVVAPAKRYRFVIVTSTEQASATRGPMQATVTAVRLTSVTLVMPGDTYTLNSGQSLPAIADVRQTRIYELEWPCLAPRAYRYLAGVSGGTFHLRSDMVADTSLLAKGRMIMLSDGAVRHLAKVTDTLTLAPSADGIVHVAVGFDPPLGQTMAKPRLNANIAPASHGETQADEPLGHGDASRRFQSFRLQRGGVTRLPATPAPRAELCVRVNGELWQEAASLFGAAANARVYTAATDDNGMVTLGFGDGTTGARLPSGASNIVARYRIGLGRDGRIRADQLTTLLTRPVGLRGITNPWAADGGSDPETIEDARTAAPATVRTFGRAVSIDDFADIVRETGLASRCVANWAWTGLERAVQLTVVGPEGARLSSAALATVSAAIGAARDPNIPMILGQVWRVPIVITARLLRDPAWEAEMVEANARTALARLFAFDAQPLGRAVHLSHVAAALQGAAGVAAADIDRFTVRGAGGWSAAALASRGMTSAPVQANIRIFAGRPLTSALDPLTQAGLALDPAVRALPAEQAFVEAPGDIALSIVEVL